MRKVQDKDEKQSNFSVVFFQGEKFTIQKFFQLNNSQKKPNLLKLGTFDLYKKSDELVL